MIFKNFLIKFLKFLWNTDFCKRVFRLSIFKFVVLKFVARSSSVKNQYSGLNWSASAADARMMDRRGAKTRTDWRLFWARPIYRNADQHASKISDNFWLILRFLSSELKISSLFTSFLRYFGDTLVTLQLYADTVEHFTMEILANLVICKKSNTVDFFLFFVINFQGGKKLFLKNYFWNLSSKNHFWKMSTVSA